MNHTSYIHPSGVSRRGDGVGRVLQGRISRKRKRLLIKFQMSGNINFVGSDIQASPPKVS